METKNGMSSLCILIASLLSAVVKSWYEVSLTSDEKSNKIHRVKAWRDALGRIAKMLGDTEDAKTVNRLCGIRESKAVCDAWEMLPECLRPLIANNPELSLTWAVDYCQKALTTVSQSEKRCSICNVLLNHPGALRNDNGSTHCARCSNILNRARL